MSSQKPLDYPVSSTLPSDSFQLLPESEKAGSAEDALYEQQLKDVEVVEIMHSLERISYVCGAFDEGCDERSLKVVVD